MMNFHAENSKKSANYLINWIREYASARLDSRLADERHCFSPHVYLDLGNQGFFGMHVPTEYGGLNLTTFDLLRVIEQVGAIDLTLATLLIESVQGAHTLKKYANENLRKLYLSQLAAGRILVAGAMTESAAGSHPRAMQAKATPDGKNTWRLNGSKRWVGMGLNASVIAVYVQQFDEDNHWLGMSGFLVSQGAAGLHIGNWTQTMGIRAIEKYDIHFDQVKVTREQLLGQIGQGMEIAQDNMMYVRLCLAAANLGAMKRSAQLMCRYATHRQIATGQLLENPVTQVCLSELTAAIDALENFIYFIAKILDEAPNDVPEEALVVAKILGSELAGWSVDRLVQLLGARGYEAASGISQLFRDIRTFRIFEGPTEALTMYVGSRMLASNTCFYNFFNKTLKQDKLYNEIQALIEKVNHYSQENKENLFQKQFSINYWSQMLIGELIAYGLLLGVVGHQLEINPKKQTERALVWVREKFDEVVKKALTFTPAEKVIIPPESLQACISAYAEKIGNINQMTIKQETNIDPMLKYDISSSTVDTSIWDKTQKQLKQNLSADISEQINFEAVCVHKLFEKQVTKTPDAIALVYYQETLTYHALNVLSNQLAHYLLKQGVVCNEPVAIYLERSCAMVIAILAILKAGGVCVPLDQTYPSERLVFMLEDSGAQIVLTQHLLAEKLSFTNQTIFKIDELDEALSLESDQNPTIEQTLENLTYILYTSGSTGRPKGVMMPHRALTNLIQWHQIKNKDISVILQFTTLSFDMSFLEIFSALTNGGKLVLISATDRLDLFNFAKIIKQNAVEQLMLPVPFLRKLAEAKLDKNYFTTLKKIITAGEQLAITPAIMTFFNQLKNCRLLNYYGPTETHVVSTYQLPEKTIDWPTHVPIGRAIPQVKLLILDEDLEPVPAGVTGEIYLGGIALAKGYMNNNSLTQKKFIFHKNFNELLYKTGDFGKYLPDNNIIYLGRQDEQVKISGYTVELQEVEMQLAKYPGIQDVAVIASSNSVTSNRLEAFFVTDAIVDKNYLEQVRAYLTDQLPAYMVPSIFHPIECLPLLPSGKIDKQMLTKLASMTTSSIEKVEQPVYNETEAKFVGLLENFFQSRVSLNHSFISIGGNSLLAMTIASLLYDEFGVEIPAYAILSTPTIRDIMKQLDLVEA